MFKKIVCHFLYQYYNRFIILSEIIDMLIIFNIFNNVSKHVFLYLYFIIFFYAI